MPEIAIPLDRRSTEQRTRDVLVEILPEIHAYIDRVVERRVEAKVNDVLDLFAAAGIPAIADASSIRFEVRKTGNGMWTEPPTIQHLLTAHAKGRPFRIVLDYPGAKQESDEPPAVAPAPWEDLTPEPALAGVTEEPS